MLRKLTENDRKQVLAFVSEEPSINLFIIGDIEKFGFDKDFQEVWGSFDDHDQLIGVLLRYNENFIPYFKDKSCDIQGYVNIIKSYDCRKMISGKEDVVDRFKGVLDDCHVKSSYFCEITHKDKLLSYEEGVKRAGLEDAPRIYELLQSIEEFLMTDTNSVQRIRLNMEHQTGRMYYIENEQGDMVSLAQTTAENSKSAMVVGVATKVGYRRKGYMGRCLSKLCGEVLDEGKTLCLFYHNPDAGSVYHRIGFEPIGKWKMMIEKRK
ncbi:GNAT family N-acetyltransferase [Vallitalea pronyensis]|uniref:GNAT family N-acetyltransferase n=1 Tax=Vallitalea pronyensis TaxID=1348613 RepID=A0A8J8SG50_9FIRM|nr:GNAT family N-acetyltransferase [Vallitalea pronyensis]QUI22019.1 GNAT family N-acetyltransferase [Vallitalea pronyensis]